MIDLFEGVLEEFSSWGPQTLGFGELSYEGGGRAARRLDLREDWSASDRAVTQWILKAGGPVRDTSRAEETALEREAWEATLPPIVNQRVPCPYGCGGLAEMRPGVPRAICGCRGRKISVATIPAQSNSSSPRARSCG